MNNITTMNKIFKGIMALTLVSFMLSSCNVINDLKARAEQGDAEAQLDLGWRYQIGDGVPRDFNEAVKWYSMAAEQGLAAAQNNLGFCYQNAYGVTLDHVEAVKLYHKSAEQGYVNAQFNLGQCYYFGDGVAPDLVEAVKWYRKAAEQGVPESINKLNELGIAW